MSTVTLESGGGEAKKTFTIPLEVANMSGTLKNMVEEGFASEGAAIPLADVKANILEKVIEFCTYRSSHPYTPEELKNDKSLEFLDKDNYDKNFVDVEQSVLFDLILAANFLDIKPLLDLTCKKVAYMIKLCKTPEELRQKFNIECDFTPEEIADVRKENEWCQER